MVLPPLMLGILGMAVIGILTYFLMTYCFRSVTFEDMMSERNKQHSKDKYSASGSTAADKKSNKKERQKAKKAEKKTAAAATVPSAPEPEIEEQTIAEPEPVQEKSSAKKNKKKKTAAAVATEEVNPEPVAPEPQPDNRDLVDATVTARQAKKKRRGKASIDSMEEKQDREIGEKEGTPTPVVEEVIEPKKDFLTFIKEEKQKTSSKERRRNKNAGAAGAGDSSVPMAAATIVVSPNSNCVDEVLVCLRKGDLSDMHKDCLLQGLEAVPAQEAEVLRRTLQERERQARELELATKQLRQNLHDESARSKQTHSAFLALQGQIQAQTSKLEMAKAQAGLLEVAQKDQERLRQFENQYAIVNDELKKRVLQCDRAERERKIFENQIKELKQKLQQQQHENGGSSQQVAAAVSAAKNEHQLALEAEVRQRKQMEEQLQRFTAQMTKRDEDLTEAKRELELQRRNAAQATTAVRASEDKLQSEVRRLTNELENERRRSADMARSADERRSSELAVQQEEKNELVRKLQETSARLDKLSAQMDELKTENESLRASAAQAQAAAEAAQSTAAAAVSKTPPKSKSNNSSVDGGETDLLAELRADLERSKNKNNELRTKNWEVAEELSRTREELKKSTSSSPPASSADDLKRIQSLEKELQEVKIASDGQLSKISALDRELQDSKTELAKAWAEAKRYQQCLSETDSTLQKLQSSVDEEQAKWSESLADAEKESEEARKEVERLLPMEARLVDVERLLQCEREECEKLKLQVTTTSTTSVVTTNSTCPTQSSNCELPNGNSNDNGVASPCPEEMAELRQQLATATKAKDDLTKANTRLTKLISIGQDALKQEQDLVAKLQAQKG